MTASLAERLAALPAVERTKALAALSDAEAAALEYDWPFWARPEQLPPSGDWLTWLILAGRGAGKTRTGAEWVRGEVDAKRVARIALVAETQKDLEEVMVFGDSGILSVFPPRERPKVVRRPIRIEFASGAIALGYNATEPDQLRGPQFDCAWCDEMAKWRYAQETWDMLQFGLRLGKHPRQVVTTTPRPIKLLKALAADPTTVVTKGKTADNRVNLAPSFLRTVVGRYAGTRLGRQELDAEILDDMPNALWTRRGLDETRRKKADVPELRRVVVAVDPAAKSNQAREDGAATGIVVAAIGEDGRGYVLDDATVRASPEGWARRAVACYDRFDADCIVGEANQGGDMVESTIRAVRPSIPYRAVTATRGKWVRAEPISALYEQGRVSHVGTFAELEDEMVAFGPDGMADGASPDRVDALVWALTELFPQMTRRQTRVVPRIENARGYDALSGSYRV